MQLKTQKIITAGLNLIVVVWSFEILITILNLNQPAIFARTAFIVGLFYILQIVLLYDLHFKNKGALGRARQQHGHLVEGMEKNLKVFFSAFWDRCAHLREIKFIKQWLNYLILPGIIFWSTIAIFFVEFGFLKVQQSFAILSSLALFINYFYLKEIFLRGKERVDTDVFVMMSMIKIYASAIAYGASIAIIRRYCLDSRLLVLGIFAITFLLIWQALYQHKKTGIKNLSYALLMSVVMAELGNLVLVYWGYNHFTAAIFLATCYNLMWGVFHYKLDKALTVKALLEILLVSAIILGMIFGVTNFRARLLDDCRYEFSL
jgi:hypothetical protein